MRHTDYFRPKGLAEAQALLAEHPEAQVLAGGQSLLAAMKLGLCQLTHWVDLQDLEELRHIARHDDHLWIGAMVTHETVANSAVVRAWCPLLANLAGGIADAQIRHVGTLGGSLANNDPAACWPAGVLACGATVVTTQREIAADNFFIGLFSTALQAGELILGVKFATVVSGHYLKFEQAASRFALVGVAVTRRTQHSVRVAVTGLGQGVTRWHAAEDALSAQWSVSALDGLFIPDSDAMGDVHASASYRAHMAAVLCRRAVAHQTHEPAAMPRGGVRRAAYRTSSSSSHTTCHTIPPGHSLHGEHVLNASLHQVWQALLDPTILQMSIPGCSAMRMLQTHQYQASIKVGLGPVSAQFETQVELHPEIEPNVDSTQARCGLQVSGQAGALGSGQADLRVHMQQEGTHTRLIWSAQPQLQGRLAQLGNRLINASAQRLSSQFFERFAHALSGEPPRDGARFFFYAFTQPLRHWWQQIFRK
jgi:carbon-monoxide dehydrogenase medium subunit